MVFSESLRRTIIVAFFFIEISTLHIYQEIQTIPSLGGNYDNVDISKDNSILIVSDKIKKVYIFENVGDFFSKKEE